MLDAHHHPLIRPAIKASYFLAESWHFPRFPWNLSFLKGCPDFLCSQTCQLSQEMVQLHQEVGSLLRGEGFCGCPGSYIPRCSMSIGDFVGNLGGTEGPLFLGQTQSTFFCGDVTQITISSGIITGGSLGSQAQTDCLYLVRGAKLKHSQHPNMELKYLQDVLLGWCIVNIFLGRWKFPSCLMGWKRNCLNLRCNYPVRSRS